MCLRKTSFIEKKQKTLLTINEKIDILMTFKLGSSVHKKTIVNHRLGESIYNI